MLLNTIIDKLFCEKSRAVNDFYYNINIFKLFKIIQEIKKHNV